MSRRGECRAGGEREGGHEGRNEKGQQLAMVAVHRHLPCNRERSPKNGDGVSRGQGRGRFSGVPGGRRDRRNGRPASATRGPPARRARPPRRTPPPGRGGTVRRSGRGRTPWRAGTPGSARAGGGGGGG